MKIQSKRFSRKSKAFLKIETLQTLFCIALLFMLWSCTPSRKAAQPLPQKAHPAETKEEKHLQTSPRKTAAIQLTEHGRKFLEEGSLDNAIRMLERAISLNPTNSGICYYLAEAWISKKNYEHAREFNKLAWLYLGKNAEWMNKIREQKNKIEDLDTKLH